MDARDTWQPVVGRWYRAMGLDTTAAHASPHQTKWHRLRSGCQDKTGACYGLCGCGREIRLVGTAGKERVALAAPDRCQNCDRRTDSVPQAP